MRDSGAIHCRVDFTDGTITVPKAKDIPAVLHRKFKGTVKTVTVSMTPSGKYYASVLVDTSMQEIQPLEPVLRTSLGIDLSVGKSSLWTVLLWMTDLVS